MHALFIAEFLPCPQLDLQVYIYPSAASQSSPSSLFPSHNNRRESFRFEQQSLPSYRFLKVKMQSYLTLLTLFLSLLTHGSPIPDNWPVTYKEPLNLNAATTPNSTTIRNTTILADKSTRIKPQPPSLNNWLTPQGASGDVLNTTRCYCASPDWKNDHVFGYYYDINYYNKHHDAVYNFDLTCNSSDYKMVKHFDSERLQPECLRARHHEKYCTGIDNRGEIGNTFCYEFNNGGYRDDMYYYNKQKRGLKKGPAWRESEKETLSVCGELCGRLEEKMVVLDGEAVTAVVGQAHGAGAPEWSQILSFGDTDDMCERCE